MLILVYHISKNIIFFQFFDVCIVLFLWFVICLDKRMENYCNEENFYIAVEEKKIDNGVCV